MRQLHAAGYDVADNLLAAFAAAGYLLEPGDKILDFGCGDGALVYRLRELGYDAFGFDIHNRVAYRNRNDIRFFRMQSFGTTVTSDTRIDPESFRIGFEADTFDVVVSTSVLEHVMHIQCVSAELARVTKAQGFNYHLYPNKNVFVEPHMYVPFASRLQSRWWLMLWARAGVRNEFQEKFGAADTTAANLEFCRTGLKYYTREELFAIFSAHFSIVKFVDRAYYPGARNWDFWRNRAAALRDKYPLRALSRQIKMGSLFTAGKIYATSSE